MQLLTYTDYALRVLIYVAARPDTLVSASTIAEAYAISSDHVAKAAKTLTRHGFLHAVRGAGGGVRLAKKPSEIRVGAVVRLFELERAPVSCLRDGSSASCVIEPACKLRQLFQRAESAFYRELDQRTLEDLIENRPKLVRLLGEASLR